MKTWINEWKNTLIRRQKESLPFPAQISVCDTDMRVWVNHSRQHLSERRPAVISRSVCSAGQAVTFLMFRAALLSLQTTSTPRWQNLKNASSLSHTFWPFGPQYTAFFSHPETWVLQSAQHIKPSHLNYTKDLKVQFVFLFKQLIFLFFFRLYFEH